MKKPTLIKDSELICPCGLHIPLKEVLEDLIAYIEILEDDNEIMSMELMDQQEYNE